MSRNLNRSIDKEVALANRMKPWGLVGELLGHNDLEVTRIYSHLTPKTYDWVVDLLDFRPEAVEERITRGKVARGEMFDRARLIQRLDELMKQVETLRTENKVLRVQGEIQ